MSARNRFGACSLIAFSLLCVVAQPGKAQQPVAKDALKQSLNKLVLDALAVKEKRIDETGKSEIQKIIDQGVEQLARDNFTREKVDEARRNIRRFAEELSKVEDQTIKRSIVADIFLKICPIYPFC